jgi:DNA-binding NtrC family response regulator
MATVLIVEDEAKSRKIIKDIVDHFVGCRVITAATAQEALDRVEQDLPDLMTLDMMLPGGSGAEVLKGARRIKPDLDVVVMTGYGNMDMAFDMGREGVVAFIEKINFDAQKFVTLVKKLLADCDRSKNALAAQGPEDQITTVWNSGISAALARTLDHIDALSRTDDSVFFLGEYGTCKRAAARLLHERSRRRQCPFVVLDCRNIPQGNSGHGAREDSPSEAGWIESLIGEAKGGTLLLHHIHELALRVQPRFLSLLEKTVYGPDGLPGGLLACVRIMATSTENISALVTKGLLRKELGVHLEYNVVELAPLRERKEDIGLLVRHLLPGANIRHGAQVEAFSKRAILEMTRRPWPGNLYELWYVVDRAVSQRKAGTVERRDLPRRPEDTVIQGEINSYRQVGQAKDAIIQALLLNALESSGGNQTEAARRSGLPKSTFNRLIHRHFPDGVKK